MKEEILRALEAALLRGSSLRNAMISLYNAGYTKEDIEEAAKYIVQLQQKTLQQKSIVSISSGKQVQVPTKPQVQQQTQSTQKILEQIKKIPSTTPQQIQQKPQPIVQPLNVPEITLPSSISTETEQEVSSYGEEVTKKKGSKGVVIFLSILLVFLIIGLVLTIIFREQVTDYIVDLFGLEA